MLAGLETEQAESFLKRMLAVLDQHAQARQVLTYLELADAVGMPGPHRIHRTTRLLEILMQRDAETGCPIRAALAVSRTREGLPAPGFFEHARRLGLHAGQDDRRFHLELLAGLYSDPRGRNPG